MLSFDRMVDAETLAVALTGDPCDVFGVNAYSFHSNTLCIL